MTYEFKTNKKNHSSHSDVYINSTVVSIAAPSVNLFNKIKETEQVLESFQIPYSVSIVALTEHQKRLLST